MTKSDLVDELAKRTEQTKITAETMLDAFIEIIANSLKEDQDIKLVGFGTFSALKRKARIGRNPLTGQEIQIPAKRVVAFKPGKILKDALA